MHSIWNFIMTRFARSISRIPLTPDELQRYLDINKRHLLHIPARRGPSIRAWYAQGDGRHLSTVSNDTGTLYVVGGDGMAMILTSFAVCVTAVAIKTANMPASIFKRNQEDCPETPCEYEHAQARAAHCYHSDTDTDGVGKECECKRKAHAHSLPSSRRIAQPNSGKRNSHAGEG